MKILKSIKRNPSVYLALAVIVGISVYLIVKNVSEEQFFSANAIEILTILLGVFVAFFLAERMNDRRRRDDCIEHIVLEIENFMEEDNNFKAGRASLMKQASCANRIQYLKESLGAETEWRLRMENRCVICGEIIPEGRQICPACDEGQTLQPEREEDDDE